MYISVKKGNNDCIGPHYKSDVGSILCESSERFIHFQTKWVVRSHSEIFWILKFICQKACDLKNEPEVLINS